MKRISALIMAIMILILCGCSVRYNSRMYTFYSHFNTNTTVSIIYDVNKTSTSLIRQCEKDINKILNDLDELFNIQDTGRTQKTEVMEINENAGIKPVVVSDDVFKVVNLAKELSLGSEVSGVKMYDPTIGVLWQKWDFINKGYDYLYPEFFEPLSKDIIEENLKLVNSDKIIINDDTKEIYLTDKGMILDLGSIVKGYACDKIKEYLLSQGISKAVINVGGNILLVGSYINDNYEEIKWPVQIRTPFYQNLSKEHQFLGDLSLDESTVVTSGTYEKYIKDSMGNMYHHILNPQTGYPVNNGLISVTVVTDKSVLGDGLSTLLLSLGLEEAKKYLSHQEGIEVVFVYETGLEKKVYITSGLEDKFTFNKELEKINYKYEGVL